MGVSETGANSLDKCYVSLVMGLESDDSAQQSQELSSMGAAFALVTQGDGFYTDDSFAQHGTVPYNGGYGAVLLGKVASLANMFQGSAQLESISWLKSVYQYLDNRFLPLMYHEQLMDMTRGRGVFRAAAKSALSGKYVLVYFATISQGNSDAAYRNKYLSYINPVLNAAGDLGQYYQGGAERSACRLPTILTTTATGPPLIPLLSKASPQTTKWAGSLTGIIMQILSLGPVVFPMASMALLHFSNP
ncbi:hypothetical protein KIMH_03790 [Bombiscardovia apis]|uniref:Polysaccharide lyase 8 N-terminal alpha-helical domain-containing protein n=1 Tax=Bombiscardovia apis TaxID=2932182 RepID=A0ABN6SFG4_9BIFI|nr:hypothetical protein KIMH_03790 [Bombiscardovia apis]